MSKGSMAQSDCFSGRLESDLPVSPQTVFFHDKHSCAGGVCMNIGDSGSARLERVKGIEPSSQAWEARILPLNHTRATTNTIPTR